MSIIASEGKAHNKAYLKTWNIVNTKDKDIADMFNDLRRSNAILKLALWYKKGYLTDKEAKKFTDQTYKTIQSLYK